MGIGIFYFFCSCDLDYDLMTFIYELDLYCIPWRYTRCANMNFIGQDFRKLSSDRHTQPKLLYTRYAFCGTWYLSHSHVNNERTVPVIMAGCIAHARNGRISTSGLKSDVTIVFPDPDFLKKVKIWAIPP